MRKNIYALTLLLITGTAQSFPWWKKTSLDPLPEGYEKESANYKQTKLWEFIKKEEGTKMGITNRISVIKLALQDLNPVVEHEKDTRPWRNKKLIHTRGAVAKATFESRSDHDYTGLFQGGAPYAMVRMGLGLSSRGPDSVPGMGIKLFRDGFPSGNFVAMFSVDGQDSFNFFENNFSNHIPVPSNIIGTLKFNTASKPSNMVGLSDIAKRDADGNLVPENDLRFPYKLIMIPNEDLTAMFASADSMDTLEDLFVDISSGTLLYKIYALDDVDAKDPEDRIYIGDLTASSKFIYSRWGDQYLFFKHQRMTEDLDLEPDWEIAGCPIMSASGVTDNAC